MFTGIVTEIGRVAGAATAPGGARRLRIAAPGTARALEVGDSVAVDGVCLTAVVADPETFAVEVIPESLHRTALGSLEEGDRVNLERPVGATGRFDGHIVQGHVDGVGTIERTTRDGDAVVVRVAVPAVLAPYLVEKGSVAVHGVSLTIVAVEEPPADGETWFEVALIPHTLEVTTLGGKRPGDPVNVEVDVIAKYVARWMETKR